MTSENIVPPEDIETPAPAPEIDDENDDLEPEAPPAPPENETPEEKDARIAELETRNAKLYARIQRDKNKGKPATPAAPAAKPAEPAQPASLTRDEAIVIAKGFSEEELEYAKKVAALERIKVTDAVTHDLFTGWKTKRDTAAKEQKAQLPASRGAKSTVKKSFATPGLSPEEHKQMFQEKMGK